MTTTQKPCTCYRCKHLRKFERIVDKLPEKDREWMESFYLDFAEAMIELERREMRERN